ncbi:hypothetical protein PSAR109036_09025 [Psychrobacter arenosus]|uniref:hypothetical protein n=1 Tax=Psychrobacter arenosus TaxID=256326 RepID=UPI001919EC7E|nr:hypothetical protein [Psychrobacter arenosus]
MHSCLSLSLIVLITTFSPLSYANHLANPSVGKQVVTRLQGIYVQTDRAQTFKTDDDTYWLIDKNAILDKAVNKKTGVVMQSFRLCVNGYIVANDQQNVNQYPELLVVEQVCEVS